MEVGKLATTVVPGALVQITQIFQETNQVLVFNLLSVRYELYNTNELKLSEKQIPRDEEIEDVLVIEGNRSTPGKLKRGRSSGDVVDVQDDMGNMKKIAKERIVIDMSKTLPTEVIILILEFFDNESDAIKFLKTLSASNRAYRERLNSDRIWKYMLSRFKTMIYWHYIDYNTKEFNPIIMKMLDYYTSNPEKRGRHLYKRFYEFLKKYKNQEKTWKMKTYIIPDVTKNTTNYTRSLAFAFQCGSDIFVLYTRNKELQGAGNFLFKTSNNTPLLSTNTSINDNDIIYYSKETNCINILCFDQNGFVYVETLQYKSKTADFYYYDIQSSKTNNIVNLPIATVNLIYFRRNVKCVMNEFGIVIITHNPENTDTKPVFNFARYYLRHGVNLSPLKTIIISTRDLFETKSNEMFWYMTPKYNYFDKISKDGKIETINANSDYRVREINIPMIIDSDGKIIKIHRPETGFGLSKETLFKFSPEQKTGFDLVSCQICGNYAKDMCNHCSEPFCSEKCFEDHSLIHLPKNVN